MAALAAGAAEAAGRLQQQVAEERLGDLELCLAAVAQGAVRLTHAETVEAALKAQSLSAILFLAGAAQAATSSSCLFKGETWLLDLTMQWQLAFKF